MRNGTASLIAACTLGLAACSTPPTNTQVGVVTGAVGHEIGKRIK